MSIALLWSSTWCHLRKTTTFKLNDDRESEMQNILKTSPRPKIQLHLSHVTEFKQDIQPHVEKEGLSDAATLPPLVFGDTLFFLPLSRTKSKATCYLHRLKPFWGRGGCGSCLRVTVCVNEPYSCLYSIQPNSDSGSQISSLSSHKYSNNPE